MKKIHTMNPTCGNVKRTDRVTNQSYRVTCKACKKQAKPSYPRAVVKRLVPGEWMYYILWAPSTDFSGDDTNVGASPEGYVSQQEALDAACGELQDPGY